jgi:hypothetical protein
MWREPCIEKYILPNHQGHQDKVVCPLLDRHCVLFTSLSTRHRSLSDRLTSLGSKSAGVYNPIHPFAAPRASHTVHHPQGRLLFLYKLVAVWLLQPNPKPEQVSQQDSTAKVLHAHETKQSMGWKTGDTLTHRRGPPSRGRISRMQAQTRPAHPAPSCPLIGTSLRPDTKRRCGMPMRKKRLS